MTARVPKKALIVIVAGIVLAAGLAAVRVTNAVGGDSPTPPRGDALLADINAGIAADATRAQEIGQLTRAVRGVFASTQGDPVDVDLLVGKGDVRCISVAGDAYSSSVSCFNQSDAAKTGSYQVVIPLTSDAAPLVVGFMPTGKSRAAASVGGLQAIGSTRGRIFLATLAPGALGAQNDARVSVAYG